MKFTPFPDWTDTWIKQQMKCLSGPNDLREAKIEVEHAQVFVERRQSWRTNGEMGSRVRSTNKTQKCNDPRNCLWQSGTHFTNCSKLSNYGLLASYFLSKLSFFFFQEQNRKGWNAQFPPHRILKFWFLNWENKTKPKRRKGPITVRQNRCFDCQDKERSFFTMTPH